MAAGRQATTGGSRRGAAIVLAVLVAASLILTAAANRAAGQMLATTVPGAAWFATAAIPSCALIALLFAVLGPAGILRWPRPTPVERRDLGWPAGWWLGLWLAGLAITAWATGGWITYARGGPAILAFLVFEPIGEELLFRGLIFGRAQRVWLNDDRPAIRLSAIAFSLHHIQLHSLPPGGLALAQVVFTLPTGLVFARLRARSGGLWPALLLHVATNAPLAL